MGKKKDSARKKHLKRIKDRRQALIPKRFTVSNKDIFLKIFDWIYIPLLIIGILAVLLFTIQYLNSKAKSALPKGELLPRVQKRDEQVYRYRYPMGYQLFEITDRSFIFSQENSLPKDFSIDWVNSTYDFLKEGMIRIKFASLNSSVLGIVGSDVKKTFVREPGTKTLLFKGHRAELWLEVISADGRNLLCLIGLKEPSL